MTQHERIQALARLGAALAMGARQQELRRLGYHALSAGATSDQIVGTLFAVAPIIGAARVVRAAPDVAQVAGYDIDRALESFD